VSTKARRLFFACPRCGARDSVAVDCSESLHNEAEVETVCEAGHRIRFAVRADRIVYLPERTPPVPPTVFRVR